jgi:hypothetical protein
MVATAVMRMLGMDKEMIFWKVAHSSETRSAEKRSAW